MKSGSFRHAVTTAWSAIAFFGAIASSQLAWAKDQTFPCMPDRVATTENRINIRCKASLARIKNFSVATTSAAHNARIFNLINAAEVSGRTIWITYDPRDMSGSSLGCSNADCRLATGVELR